MAYVDMYGRSADAAATFNYPGTQMPFRMAPPMFLQLPAAASRIFGSERRVYVDSDETRVQLDPTSTYEYTSRWKGMGRMGDDPAASNPAEHPFKGSVEGAYGWAKEGHPTGFWILIGLGSLLVLTGMKTLGRLAG